MKMKMKDEFKHLPLEVHEGEDYVALYDSDGDHISLTKERLVAITHAVNTHDQLQERFDAAVGLLNKWMSLFETDSDLDEPYHDSIQFLSQIEKEEK